MARAEEVMHQVEQRAEKMEKLRRELEEVMQPVDGVAEARGRERSVASRCQLVEAIQQLGYLPRQGKNSTIEEKHLAVRLSKARVADLRKAWEVRKLQQRAAVRIVKAEEMMQKVRGFGRYPMESWQDVRERQLADKLRRARKAKRFRQRRRPSSRCSSRRQGMLEQRHALRRLRGLCSKNSAMHGKRRSSPLSKTPSSRRCNRPRRIRVRRPGKGASYLTARSASAEEKRGARRLFR